MKKTQGLWGTGAQTEISLKKKFKLEMSVEKKTKLFVIPLVENVRISQVVQSNNFN